MLGVVSTTKRAKNPVKPASFLSFFGLFALIESNMFPAATVLCQPVAAESLSKFTLFNFWCLGYLSSSEDFLSYNQYVKKKNVFKLTS